MRHFSPTNGQMMAEQVSLATVAAEVGTPAYVYSAATFTRHYQVFAKAVSAMDSLIAYSVKANSNQAVLSLLAKLGSGADVVSGGELARALAAGISADKIIFSGVGKSAAEMRAGLEAGIAQFNIESMPELEQLNVIALDIGKIAPVAVRINPNVCAGTHEKISTGRAENKFGIDIADVDAVFERAVHMPGIHLQGIAMHIGSQIDNLAPFASAITLAAGLIERLRKQGHKIETFDIGGGLGISYAGGDTVPPTPREYGDLVRRLTQDLGVRMIFEPGRMIAGNAGVLLAKVLYVKHGGARNFLIIDAAMNDLIRPALYDAYHDIEPVKAPAAEAKMISYDVVGPICESGDTFTQHRMLPEMQAGDLIVLHTAGAYGAVQASQYNSRPLIPEVLVKDDQYAVVRKRPSMADILKTEHVPDWV
ncbi:MAG: diaminopimelate decarboxylase [Robiginitomaculum sp.]|nr:MAG: diaminopimelate decarboxylase [Robiginitomaculum sp.]